jgi:hypothetical protein
MFRLLWVIFRHKFQDLLYILFYSFYCNSSTKTVRHKSRKTICTISLEIYAWRWLTRVETCNKVNIYVILKLSKYVILLCRRKIYCRFTINRFLPLALDTPISNCKAAVLVLVRPGYFISPVPAISGEHPPPGEAPNGRLATAHEQL